MITVGFMTFPMVGRHRAEYGVTLPQTGNPLPGNRRSADWRTLMFVSSS